MDSVLVKIFAAVLALSQVTTKPEATATHFDPMTDQATVSETLRAGCTHMREAFGIENLDLDDLIKTALDDPGVASGTFKGFHGINFNDLYAAYRQFCKDEPVAHPAVDIGQVIDYYNRAAADLPDPARFKNGNLPGTTVVLDGKGKSFSEIFEPNNRRRWTPLGSIPLSVQQAFIAAEDKRFYQHHGIDERGLVRAFVNNLARPGRPSGGSTITQQLAKNLLVGDDVTYDRKIREILVAAKIEQTYTKPEILELYLNSIYLGRNSWGVDVAARSYFGKPASALTLREGALLAALAKGPNYFNPERHPDRARERLAYVVDRMQEDGFIDAAQQKDAQASLPDIAARTALRRDSGLYYIDFLTREAKLAGLDGLDKSYVVHSSINPDMQRATESALQLGLARYEAKRPRAPFHGAEVNLADAVQRISASQDTAAKPDAASANAQDGTTAKTPGEPAAQTRRTAAAPVQPAAKPPWLLALLAARLPLYDVHLEPAIVISQSRTVTSVGLPDGRTASLRAPRAATFKDLKPYDVVYVEVIESKRKSPLRAELRPRPSVQGAALVLENKTGRILAMAGGFSYPLSQLNRTAQTQRQPGSALKPVTYLAALQSGLQPNTLVLDEPITFAPIGDGREDWSPANYQGRSSGITTLRRGLENSKNLVTARLLEGGIDADPVNSLDRVCALAVEAKIYPDCVRFYPFVLGAQPVRMIDLASFYAAIANEGVQPVPYAIDSIEQNGLRIYSHAPSATNWTDPADRAAFYQLKTMLQGVVARGTARSMRSISAFVGGKTGTTDDSNDAWFIGFTNDVTIAVWVGYDNADGKRQTLGDRETGASVAVPIFEPIVAASWDYLAPRAALNPPSPQAQRELRALPIDLHSGQRVSANDPRAFTEYFRLTADGTLAETQYQLVSRDDEIDFQRDRDDPADSGPLDLRAFQAQRGYPPPGYEAPDNSDEDRRPRRVDPEYFFPFRLFN